MVALAAGPIATAEPTAPTCPPPCDEPAVFALAVELAAVADATTEALTAAAVALAAAADDQQVKPSVVGGLPLHALPKVFGGHGLPALRSALAATVLGGAPVTERDGFADVVAIDTAAGALCTGIAVGPRTILTAAHCGPARQIRPRTGPPIAVIARAVAPARADAAALTLATPLAVAPRPRARGFDDPSDGRVRVIGFGADDPSGARGAGAARWGELYVDDWRCDGARAATTGCRPGLEVIIPAIGVDACRGDSGGPLVDWRDGGWRLLGLTSRGLPGAPTPCGHGGIYVHVGPLADWLDSQTEVP